MSVAWTEDQKRVIEARDRNLLVSAAAGSGKTAVLVERILSLILDSEKPVEVDRLLVTTFTKAAASQMRERIGKALNERLQSEPENEWLQRQEALLGRAQITTIHGFCLYVIRNYFHTIELNPSFRIADEGEMRLLKQDVADEILEEAFAEAKPEFLRFAESYGSGNRGSGLEDLIFRLYEYAVANPQPEKWLNSCADWYEIPENGGWSEFAGTLLIREEIQRIFEDCREQLSQAMELTGLAGGPVAYREALRADLEMVEGLLDCAGMEELEEALQTVSYPRLPSRRSKAMADADEELCDRIMELRNQVKESMKALRLQYFGIPSEQVFLQLRETAANVRCYADLTLRFMDRLTEKKRKKNILDFSDQEHLALRILTREENGVLVPSETAEIFSAYYEEVMVDEYQDSNLVQEAILESISGNRHGRENRFMVGDVKQSIYRFRQAEPGLFLEKYSRYEKGEEGLRIDLHQNFRSRKEVLEAVNEIFRKIMRPELGGILYDEAAELRAGASYPESFSCRAELQILSREEWEELHGECRWSRPEAEAHLAAQRIRRLLKEEQVWEDGTLRPARPDDIVILLRTMSGWSDIFVRVLQEEGIPAKAQSREGYFQTLEIEGLLAYLKVLDNPTQEIPLAASMKGVLGNFSSEELARIKSAYPGLSYRKACMAYAKEGEEERLREKLKSFYDQLEKYRSRSVYTSIHELLWQIVNETGYLDKMRALPGGEQRAANVEMLLQKAVDYEKISYHGLFHFIRYIEKMQKYQMDYGEAALPGDGGSAVRIMSIHHSKGLEFPIVLAAGMGKSFNRQESREKAVFHSRYGVGLDYVDLKNRMRCPTILKKLIRRQNLLEGLGEELRVLYVAMTRAKEKLILTGMVPEKLLEAPGRSEGDSMLAFSFLSRSDCALGWILPARKGKGSVWQLERVPLEQVMKNAVQEQMKNALSREELEKVILFQPDSDIWGKRIDEKLSWSYPWDTDQSKRQKYSVTELKRLRMLEEAESSEELYPESDVIPLVPHFLKEKQERTGAERGTLYHNIMEAADFAECRELSQINEVLLELVHKGKLEDGDLDSVQPEDFLVFARSSLAERMHRAREAGALYREQPFVIGLPEKEIYGSGGEELVLIQGIIDAFFCEEDGLVVVDYKTDRVFRAEELAERYHSQLEYYDRALRMMTGKPVKERLIYSFALGKAIRI